jgi:hypothetical protein
MMRMLVVAALLLATPAFAQTPQRYTLAVTPDQLQVILNALTDVENTPWKKINPVIIALIEQMKAQQAAAAQPAPVAPPAPPPAPPSAPPPTEK